MKQFIIIHYHEIALKKGNRIYFEKKLQENIVRILKGLEYEKVERLHDRILIELNSKSDFEKIKAKLLLVFGIAYFCQAFVSSYEINILKKNALEIFQEECKKKTFRTFRIETRRTWKDYPYISRELNEKIGEHILEKTKNIKVKLKNPEFILYIDVNKDKTFIYSEKIRGQGGLPSSTAGKVLSLISSGFDSPLASFKIMKRGARVSFVHFHSYPQTNKASVENVKRIVKRLTLYQFESTLYLVPFLAIQKEVHLKCRADLKVILYRRLMIRIAEKIAGKERAKALITGEDLGQVASQTLENIQVINEVATLPILRPLIGFDKEEIINETKKIGTFDISSQPYQDCCSLFVPKHPKTGAGILEVRTEEKKLDIEKIVKKAIDGIEKIEIKTSN